MIILGLDPGYADTGWGVITRTGDALSYVACGSITTDKGKKHAERLADIERALESIINTYKPDLVGIEQLFFNTNVTTALQVAQARGVLLLTAQKYLLTIIEPTPSQIKQALTATGNAPKQQVARMVMLLLKMKTMPKPDDALDALACALCAGFQNSFTSRLPLR